jgi:hypothetical protein
MKLDLMNLSKKPSEEPLAWKQIVGKAVHDMRSPLSTMRTTLEILRMLPPNSDQYGKMISMLDSQVNVISGHLETLINCPETFLDLSSHDS